MHPKTAIWILYGVGILFGIFSLLALFGGSWGGFLGFAVFSLGFTGFGWAFRRLGCPREGESRGDSVGLVALVLFGGAGLVMVIGSFFLLADGELGGLALTVFGLVFCGAGYLARRVFSTPKGTKEVLVNETERTSTTRYGGTRTVTRQQYRLVDKNMSDAEIQAQQQEWADRPWTQREDWVAGAVQQADHLDLRLLIGFTIAWNALSSLFAGVELRDAWDKGWGSISFIPFLFPAIGVVLAVFTIRTWLRQRKFGMSLLRLHTVPAWLGERLHAVVETNIPARAQPGPGFRVRVACLMERTHHSRRGGDQTSTELIWEREEEVHAPLDASPLRIPIDVALPDSLPSTEMPPRNERVLWRLTVSRALPGIDYRAVFDVPVFRKNPAIGQPETPPS